MKTIFEHIAYAKKQPYHVRKRIAFTAAASCSAFIALVWLIGSFSSGAFAIQGNTSSENTEQASTDVTSTKDSGMAGAAAALPSANAQAHIEIIDTAASTSAKHTVERTTIPF